MTRKSKNSIISVLLLSVMFLFTPLTRMTVDAANLFSVVDRKSVV